MSEVSVSNLVMECRNPTIKSRGYSELKRLGRQVRKAISAGQFSSPTLKITILSSFLTDLVVDLLPVFLLRHNVIAEIRKGPYGSIATEILGRPIDDAHQPDLSILLPTHRDLGFFPSPGSSTTEADAAVTEEVKVWTNLWSRLSRPIVQMTFDPPPTRALAEADGFLPGGLLRHVRKVNFALADAAPARLAFVDSERLASQVGAAWHDPRLYQLCKQPFSMSVLPELADRIASAAAGALGRSRKVLALDLDNTLWGGIVGDVGLEGLVLGPETAEGEAFVAIQNYAKALASRGVILAVCSKNQHDNAIEPFRSHAAMILREDDIACFLANFEDKATSLRRIAATLNVGLDSIVFVDDNPVERAWIARELPEVLVVDLPKDPAEFCQAIENANAFPLFRVTEEDVARNASYRARSQTIAMGQSAGDIDSFLASLDPVAQVEPVSPASLDRIVQLVAKTNQFKLNPGLFTSEQIAANNDGVLAIRFKDKLQDYGITAIAVTDLEGEELVVRNWVMSCRVFSRRLEYATLELLRRKANKRGASSISLNYQPSSKNGIVKDVLSDLGFVPQGGGGRFVAPVRASVPQTKHHIEIVGDWAG
ncbi:HAD-IIIC family phosphatase [Bradyrhizobium sp.]|uniref:HAD-IIIC family phosphatase n=1 Tax=Bradyrhizobium sp. TaxID=376 RepID=UPI003C751AE4